MVFFRVPLQITCLVSILIFVAMNIACATVTHSSNTDINVSYIRNTAKILFF